MVSRARGHGRREGQQAGEAAGRQRHRQRRGRSPCTIHCPLGTHVVPAQGSFTVSATRLFWVVSRLLPREHLLKVPPTVGPLGFISANTARLTWLALNLGRAVLKQEAPAALTPTTAGQRHYGRRAGIADA